MALNTRVKKLEQVLTPPGEIIVVAKWSCMDEKAVKAEVRRQLGGREPDQAHEVHLFVFLDMWTECPPGPHTHTDGSPGYPLPRTPARRPRSR